MFSVRRPGQNEFESRDNTPLWGALLVGISVAWWLSMMFSLVGAKFLSAPTGNPLVDFLRVDWYYCSLIPLTLIVMVVAVILNWLSMKFFRHN